MVEAEQDMYIVHRYDTVLKETKSWVRVPKGTVGLLQFMPDDPLWHIVWGNGVVSHTGWEDDRLIPMDKLIILKNDYFERWVKE
jgi:hypothetical protein